MAYAQLAGLPAYYGLYAAFLPTMIAALFGSCGQLHTGPVAMTSLLTFAVATQIHPSSGDTGIYINTVLFLALLAGIIQLIFGLMRLAVFVNFLSHPVMLGFTNASALIIISSQLPLLLGISSGRTGNGLIFDLSPIIFKFDTLHLPTLIFAVMTIIPLFYLKKNLPKFPSVAFVVLLSIIISYGMDFNGAYGGAIIGAIPSGLPKIELPTFNWAEASSLLGGALMIALIGFMEVLATTKAISAKTKEKMDFNQELVGQGLSKIFGSLVQSFPVSGSFSRSALNLYSGAKTGMSSIFAGIFVMLSLLFLTDALRFIPKAVLASVIIVAVSGLIDFKSMLRIWKLNNKDGLAALATFIFSVILAPNVTLGVLIGIGITVAFHLFHLMKPHVAFLSMHPDGTFRDAEKHKLPHDSNTIIIRFEGRLVFANASHFEEKILDAISEAPDTKAVILQADSINEIDATGEETLRNIVNELRQNNISFAISEMKWRVLEDLEKADFYKILSPEKFFRTTAGACESLKHE